MSLSRKLIETDVNSESLVLLIYKWETNISVKGSVQTIPEVSQFVGLSLTGRTV